MRLLHAAVLLLLVIDVTPATPRAQEIRISHQWAEHTDARDRAARIFVQEVEKRTRELSFRIYPNSSLNIKPSDLLGALQDESLEMAIYPLAYAASKAPEFSLAGLPALVPNVKAARALKSSAIFLMLQSLAEDNGFKILALLWNPGGFLGKQREISGPASVQGLRIRVSEPLFGVMLKDAGASVTTAVSFGSQLPPNYAVFVDSGQSGVVGTVTARTSTGFNVVLSPLSTSGVVAAGSFNVLVVG